MLFAETPDNLGTILTAVGGAVTAVLTGLVTVYLMLRRGRTKSKQEEDSWAVREARDAYRELKKQMSDIWAKERDCQIRLATYITRDRALTARVRELEKRLGIEHGAENDDGLDSWADDTLAEQKRQVHDGSSEEHPRSGD